MVRIVTVSYQLRLHLDLRPSLYDLGLIMVDGGICKFSHRLKPVLNYVLIMHACVCFCVFLSFEV